MSLQSVEAISSGDFEQLSFDFLGKPIVVEASSRLLSSDGGLIPICQFDERIGLTSRMARAIVDRRSGVVNHTVEEMFRCRVYGLLAGYEDQNDHDALRFDPVFKMVAGRYPQAFPLASQPTLSRFENAITVKDLFRLRDALAESWLDSFEEPPARVTLDLDAVDDPTHGEQQLTLFHGFYEQWQYLPILISHAESEQFVLIGLRFGTASASLGVDDDLVYLARRIRERFPDVEIVVRADSGFGTPRMYETCESLGLTFTIGLGSNSRLKMASDALLAEAERRYAETGQPQRLFDLFEYQAESWNHARTVIVKAECHAAGTNRRFVVTNRPGAAIAPKAVYDEFVMRGESENRNKEIKVDLEMDRLSDHRFMANFFRLYLSTTAHNLIVRLRQATRLPSEKPEELSALTARSLGLTPGDPTPPECFTGDTRLRWQRRARNRDPLGRGQTCTWRLGFIKVAVEIVESCRRILVRLAANWPFLSLYQRIGQLVVANQTS